MYLVIIHSQGINDEDGLESIGREVCRNQVPMCLVRSLTSNPLLGLLYMEGSSQIFVCFLVKSTSLLSS